VTEGQLRKDAARSRAAILAAARELFATGRDVPMYEIGRRAGVGQATLYRHFPDRSAIAEAVLSEQLERLEAIAAAHADDERAVLVLLDAATEGLVEIHDLVGILRDDQTRAPVLRGLRLRMYGVLEEALERSRPVPLLRAGVETQDLMLLLNMVNGALFGIATVRERRLAAARALDIALRGMLQSRDEG
jgi:AcrR family transcriptional regulator